MIYEIIQKQKCVQVNRAFITLNAKKAAEVSNYHQVTQAYEGNAPYNNSRTNDPHNCLIFSDIYTEDCAEKLTINTLRCQHWNNFCSYDKKALFCVPSVIPRRQSLWCNNCSKSNVAV